MTDWKYSNTPTNTTFHPTADKRYDVAHGYSTCVGWFLAIRDNEAGELVKEEFYTTKSGRNKADQKAMSKLSPKLYA